MWYTEHDYIYIYTPAITSIIALPRPTTATACQYLIITIESSKTSLSVIAGPCTVFEYIVSYS